MLRWTKSLILALFFTSLRVYGGAVELVSKPTPTVYVLAVGVNEYANTAFPPLRSPEREAEMFLKAMIDPTNGLATPKTAALLRGGGATRAAAMSVLTTYRSLMKADDVLVLYWSSHTTRSKTQDDVFLIPYDGTATDETVISLVRDIIPAATRQDTDVVIIIDGCNIGSALDLKLAASHPRLSVLSSAKADEFAYEDDNGSAFARALQEVLASSATDFDHDGAISVEEVYIAAYPKVVTQEFARQHPTISGSRVHRVTLTRTPAPEEGFEFDEPIPSDIADAESVWINDKQVTLNKSKTTQSRIVVMGNASGLLGHGLTYVRTAKNDYLFWREEQSLRQFEKPYRNSYAVIVAIDDYARVNDPKKRGPTGYEARGLMVQRGRELANVLTRLGFPRSNIVEVYDQHATSVTIESILKTFWRGGSRAAADRVLFYFGGHGDTIDDTGVLITYDFDAAAPTQTGFLMRDLSTRHAENMVSRHVLFTLDACASGLAVYKRLGPPTSGNISQLGQLSIVRNDTAEKARNFLVAGTVDQAVLWDNGGIFTQALIAGLSGKADTNRDRIIQFWELANFVSNEVSIRAATKNVQQQVQPYLLDALGHGKVVFLEER